MRLLAAISLAFLVACSDGDSVTNYTKQSLVDVPSSIAQEDAIMLAEATGKEINAEASAYFASQHKDIPMQALNHLAVRWGQSINHTKGSHHTYIKLIAAAENPISDDSILAEALGALTEFSKAKLEESVATYNKAKQAGTR